MLQQDRRECHSKLSDTSVFYLLYCSHVSYLSIKCHDDIGPAPIVISPAPIVISPTPIVISHTGVVSPIPHWH